MSQPGGPGADAHEASQPTIASRGLLVKSTLIKQYAFRGPRLVQSPRIGLSPCLT
jgi:hypothetical protein